MPFRLDPRDSLIDACSVRSLYCVTAAHALSHPTSRIHLRVISAASNPQSAMQLEQKTTPSMVPSLTPLRGLDAKNGYFWPSEARGPA